MVSTGLIAWKAILVLWPLTALVAVFCGDEKRGDGEHDCDAQKQCISFGSFAVARGTIQGVHPTAGMSRMN